MDQSYLREVRRRRRAYDTYLALQNIFNSLPDDHPAALHLQQAVAAADLYWRQLQRQQRAQDAAEAATRTAIA